MSTAPTPTPAHPVEVSAGELRTWLAGDAAPRVLDVRTPGEYAAGHVPGSYNIPLATLTEHARSVADHLDQEVVLVCRSGTRASAAAQVLAGTGGTGMHVLTGGIQSWSGTGGEVRETAGPWELERQVRLVAGGVVLTSVLASTVAPGAKWVAAGIGGGLTFAALSNTCAMGQALMRMPWNRGGGRQLKDALSGLAGRAQG
ncbi:rhodanese-like domain-containing protein [uncultured Serinicoccus sp.]|uniref:rhodanese-like domain-containing protein n=1 Tax=uncultured Serinicoccus sp. TaxID=735514 RepID=UPI00261DC758|nr:rhodanese-like domain-containing protein [uncultured Serinicoccus sp.]